MGGSERLLTSFAASCTESPGLPQVFVVINDKINAYLAENLAATGHPVYFLKRPPRQRNPRIVLTLLNIMRRHDVRMIHAHDTGAKHFAMLSKLYRPMSVGYTIHNTGLVPGWDHVKVRLHRRFVDWNIAISAAVARECETARLQRIFKVHNAIPLARFPQRCARCGRRAAAADQCRAALSAPERPGYLDQGGGASFVPAGSTSIAILLAIRPKAIRRCCRPCSASPPRKACWIASASSATGPIFRLCSGTLTSLCCRRVMKASGLCC